MRLNAFLLLALLAQAQQPKFEFDVATVKNSDPNTRGSTTNTTTTPQGGSLTATNTTLKHLIAIARHVREAQILGGPSWIGAERFDIQAKYEAPPSPPDTQPPTDAQKLVRRRQFEERVDSLLADRFHLALKHETREMPVYYLVIAKGGSKLQPAKEPDGGHSGTHSKRGVITATSTDLESVANTLAAEVDTLVLNKTGLTGRFDWQLEWTPDPAPGTAAPELSGPSLFTALQEQLGLKLESQKAAMPVVVVERAEKPSAN